MTTEIIEATSSAKIETPTAAIAIGSATKRFRAVFPRPLYKMLLKEAVDQDVAPNEMLVRVVGEYFGEAK